MPAPKNTLKQAMAEGRLLRGLWLALGSETVTDIAGRAGFDWCLIDGEHGPWDPTGIRRQLMVLAGTPTAAVVRVPVGEAWVLKQALDLGAQTIMVPMINSTAEAKAAVAACRYPPQGIRGNGGATMRAGGYGGIADYSASANDEVCVIVQAESRAAMADLAGIASVEGVDCVFIGPADLGADMGFRDNLAAPELWEEITRGIKVITDAGKAAGIIVSPAMAPRMEAAGITFLGLGSDSNVLAENLSALARGAR
ncbi:HpcH/HpaI aldolase family protein [Roseicyclus mahoneyensis]|uniref:2,4-dihydroxyhept-2-enedioate aldolase n=1 Tax=Roseicyclus mahoneyensis TaxID=164332 RepID=A0A316GNN4_9RHOB|nr:aldolase/citrate lyase family protein [Roseicyclus mahoneyensis]PWK62494.1 2,4-dihydroxyhept-2-enedioate aldolase [Roseicyclus mahoneyensis]